jgi:hypothetical protein
MVHSTRRGIGTPAAIRKFTSNLALWLMNTGKFDISSRSQSITRGVSRTSQ